jgi:hypothetical protein
MIIRSSWSTIGFAQDQDRLGGERRSVRAHLRCCIWSKRPLEMGNHESWSLSSWYFGISMLNTTSTIAITFRSECSTSPANYSDLREVTSTHILSRTYGPAHVDAFSHYQGITEEPPAVAAYPPAPCRPFFRTSPSVRTLQQASRSQFALALFQNRVVKGLTTS